MDDPLAGIPDALGLPAAGLGVWGCLGAARYDALVPPAWRCAALLPEARSALVVANGGRALWAAFQASPEASRRRDPLDRYTRRVVGAAAEALAPGSLPLFYFERRGRAYADFVALGQAAGLGAPSRLGLLLHPRFGPWLAIRAIIMTPRELPETRPLESFDPCEGCPAPCADACHGDAVAPGGFDAAACGRARRRLPACELRCDARRACVVGPEHAYSPGAEAHHARSLRSLLP